MEPPYTEQGTAPPAIFAWLVHAFTASGAVLAFLALLAVERADWGMALLWLLIALAVDGVDGSLARMARVKERAPRIDGDTMDLVIDYLNYVFVPALLIVRAELVPAALAVPMAALILVSALYNFTRRDLKTEDNYFRGFPALWNVIAFYLFVARPGPEAGAITVCAFAALTFAPVHFVHPFRVRDYGRWLPVLAVIWALATAALLWPGWSGEARAAWLAVSLASAAALLALGLLRSLRGSRKSRAPKFEP
ncbi:MAG TPA: CDP-alcohol phosphatidyltransferase family protein [Allosphingosinicella sp.]|nr:CDP-alcohol phosphatidyltransferase family protein [Allosphingosinicella sp.]